MSRRVKIEIRQRKKGVAFLLDYSDNKGQRQRRVFRTASTAKDRALCKRETEMEALRIEVQLYERSHHARQGERLIDSALIEFVELKKMGGAKLNTIISYKETFKKFRAFLKTTSAVRLIDLSGAVWIQWIQSQGHLSNNTIAGDIMRFAAFINWCVARGDLEKSSLKHPDVRAVLPLRTKHDRTFSADEFEAFLEVARTKTKSPQGQDYADFFLMLGESGLRLGEGLQLRVCDIKLFSQFSGQASYLRVTPHHGWTPKTPNSVRAVPLSYHVEMMVRARIAGRGLDERLFPLNWTNRSVCQQFNRVLTRAGLHHRDSRNQKLRTHSFRHHFATRLVITGHDAATIRDLLGHDSIVTTNRYFNTPITSQITAVLTAFSPRSDLEKCTKSVPNPAGFSRFQQVSGLNAVDARKKQNDK